MFLCVVIKVGSSKSTKESSFMAGYGFVFTQQLCYFLSTKLMYHFCTVFCTNFLYSAPEILPTHTNRQRCDDGAHRPRTATRPQQAGVLGALKNSHGQKAWGTLYAPFWLSFWNQDNRASLFHKRVHQQVIRWIDVVAESFHNT
jgi:hypothetical protein